MKNIQMMICQSGMDDDNEKGVEEEDDGVEKDNEEEGGEDEDDGVEDDNEEEGEERKRKEVGRMEIIVMNARKNIFGTLFLRQEIY